MQYKNLKWYLPLFILKVANAILQMRTQENWDDNSALFSDSERRLNEVFFLTAKAEYNKSNHGRRVDWLKLATLLFLGWVRQYEWDATTAVSGEAHYGE